MVLFILMYSGGGVNICLYSQSRIYVLRVHSPDIDMYMYLYSPIIWNACKLTRPSLLQSSVKAYHFILRLIIT